MDILKKVSEKIEDVRCQPAHVRMRYVWGSVAISMLFVVAIWLFSMGNLFQGDKEKESAGADASTNITEQLKNLKQQAPSLKDLSDKSLSVENEGITNLQDTNNLQYPALNNDPGSSQANDYSDLSEMVPTQGR